MPDLTKEARERLARHVVLADTDELNTQESVELEEDLRAALAHIDALEAERDALKARVALLEEAGARLVAECECPGIEVEPSVWSGCTAYETGATDCQTCGPFRAATDANGGLDG